jgi:hypothetical protein
MKRTASEAAGPEEKVLLLAVSIRDGKAIITPLDLESEGDDQTPLSEQEQQLFKQCQADFSQCREAFERGLRALYGIFAGRLCRDKFAIFENFCFALHDLGISKEKLTQLYKKASRLRIKSAGNQAAEV